jgi:hypothetical protein
MYTVRANVPKNRLYVTLVGFFHYEEMKECTDKTIEESQKLKPGFDVITDISRFKAVDQKTLEEVTRGQVYFKQSGVRHAIRVCGAAVLTGIQFARAGKAVNYVPATVATMADAERYLDAQAQPISLP